MPNVESYLNDPANPQRKNTAVGMANAFERPRAVRLGVKFTCWSKTNIPRAALPAA